MLISLYNNLGTDYTDYTVLVLSLLQRIRINPCNPCLKINHNPEIITQKS